MHLCGYYLYPCSLYDIITKAIFIHLGHNLDNLGAKTNHTFETNEFFKNKFFLHFFWHWHEFVGIGGR